MRKRIVAVAILMSLMPAAPAFSQSNYATVSGTVEDSTRAVLPGVTVTATNNATGVVTSVFSNESGAYNVASLQPGAYTVSAELPGFQTRSYTGVQLGNAERIRLNFTLSVASLATGVEVTVAADTLLATSSSSIGEVLSQQRVQDLPTISNNVLELYRTIPGIRINDNGVSGSFAGLTSFGTINMQRDGVEAGGGARWGSNANSATYMSPDLIGEVRLIIAPVDAEMGRGNAQIQFLTRSGTNQFRGTAVWAARNSALDANTWNNNNDLDPKTGAWKPTQPDWHNTHQFTGSYSGPIVKNKTFFFALWDSALVNLRTTPNSMVLTPCARNGIFRYFDNWNNGNAIQATLAGTATPAIAVVDGLGNPVPPATNPNGTPHNGTLRYASVFGPLLNTPARPDCSDAVVGRASTASGTWDLNRTKVDPTGFVAKVLGKMPLPNNYEAAGSDGLNTAGYRWVRNERGGTEGIFATNNGGITSPTNLERKQFNAKIDHNFSMNHKLGVTYTIEQSSGNAQGRLESWPDGFRSSVFRRPQILSLNFISTLSPALVNEARAGMRRTGGNTFNAFNNPGTGEAAQAFFPNIAGYPVFIGLGLGQVNFQSNQPYGGGSTATYLDTSSMWTYADSLSWTKGTHTFKFGGEIRRARSLGSDAGISVTATPRAVGGDAPLGAIPTGAIGSANMPGLAGTATTGNNVRMRNMLSFLAGSLGSVTQFYYMQDPTKLDTFEDYKTFQYRVRDVRQNEAGFFFKDDWKVGKNLTLNLGLRWDYYGSLYDGSGLTPLPTQGPAAIFGISGRGFDGWMRPGVRAEPTVFEFVGKNSPNPGKTYYPNDFNNFGPALGFAWQVPWFGAGKTTVRGGYQMTYNAGQVFNAVNQENLVPGSTLQATYTGDSGANAYLDLTKLSSLVPVPQIFKPMQPVPLSDRVQNVFIPQPGLVNPYAQNLTLSVTRSVRSNLTVDLRYIGTLARK
ncbi:MAG: TonB-dependent receptor, partial [Acidobacteria bacterium]|nr:TonB-dependent receptor [Acidobacteriota bacterium]